MVTYKAVLILKRNLEMNKGMLVGTLFIVPFLMVLTLIAMDYNRPPEWQNPINQYITYRSQGAKAQYRVLRAVRATRPWAFSPTLSQYTYGPDGRFHTDFTYGKTNPQASLSLFMPTDDPRAPLPYPPQRMYCVTLMHYGIGPLAETRLVFVALHQDLYSAEWVVHESVRNLAVAPDSMSRLAEIGCE